MPKWNLAKSEGTIEWYTPDWLYDLLDKEFKFTLDPCALTPDVAKCSKFYTADQDGLSRDWSGERVYINPPYMNGIMVRWIIKAYKSDSLCVMLLPSSTGAAWFHDWVLGKAVEIRFIRGRVRFVGIDTPPMFDSIVVVYGGVDSFDTRMSSILAPTIRQKVDWDEM